MRLGISDSFRYRDFPKCHQITVAGFSMTQGDRCQEENSGFH